MSREDPQAADSLERLLEPTLTPAPVAPLYSVTMGVIVSFLGGGFSALMFGMLNSRRLRRLAADGWLYGLGALFFGALALGLGYARTVGIGEIDEPDNTRVARYANQGLGLAYFGLIYLRHRRFFKASELTHNDRPSPWLIGIAVVVAGAVVNLVLAVAGALLGQ